MLITVMPHRYVDAGGAALAVPLAEALAHTWTTDAHVTQYAPLDTGRVAAGRTVRAAKDAVDAHPLTMVALLGDIDGPGHVATQEWRAATEAALRASPFAWYATRNGYRVLATLDTPLRVDSERAWLAWRGRYAAFVAECVDEYGLTLDPAADDPTRLFRLPNVHREGVGPVRAPVQGTPPRWTLPEAAPLRAVTSAAPSRDPRDIAAALAARLPPSVDGAGGDQALLHAASELCTVLRGDAGAIATALSGVFNPRCVPPWPAAKIQREAARAAERYRADVGERYTALRGERAAEDAAEDARNRETLAYWGRVVDRAVAPRPLPYVVESLGLAPGKCSAIQGAAGDGKTPFALLLALCVATGQPFLGHAITRTGPALYLAYEGGPLVEERDARICAGLGIARTDADVTLVHAERALDDEAIDVLAEHVTRYSPVLVVVDTYAAALPAGVDANLSLYSEPLRKLGKVSDATGALIVALMHHRKTGGGLDAITGHSTVAGALQASIALHREDPTNAPNTIGVTCRRAPRNGFTPFGIDWLDVANNAAPEGMALVARRLDAAPIAAAPTARDTTADRKRYTARRRILAQLEKGPEPRNALAQIAGQGVTAGFDALADLEEQGLVRDEHGHYSLTDGGRAESARVKGNT